MDSEVYHSNRKATDKMHVFGDCLLNNLYSNLRVPVKINSNYRRK